MKERSQTSEGDFSGSDVGGHDAKILSVQRQLDELVGHMAELDRKKLLGMLTVEDSGLIPALDENVSKLIDKIILLKGTREKARLESVIRLGRKVQGSITEFQ